MVKGNPLSVRHFAVAKVEYAQDHWGTSEESVDEGWIIYLRSSLTGDEDQVIGGFKARSPVFPHESTTDQFFTEEQFEAYRRLGEHIVDGALSHLQVAVAADYSGDLTVGLLIQSVKRYFYASAENDGGIL